MTTTEPLERRMTTLETEFHTELKHLATKADLNALQIRLFGFVAIVGGLVVGIIAILLKLWQ